MCAQEKFTHLRCLVSRIITVFFVTFERNVREYGRRIRGIRHDDEEQRRRKRHASNYIILGRVRSSLCDSGFSSNLADPPCKSRRSDCAVKGENYTRPRGTVGPWSTNISRYFCWAIWTAWLAPLPDKIMRRRGPSFPWSRASVPRHDTDGRIPKGTYFTKFNGSIVHRPNIFVPTIIRYRSRGSTRN